MVHALSSASVLAHFSSVNTQILCELAYPFLFVGARLLTPNFGYASQSFLIHSLISATLCLKLGLLLMLSCYSLLWCSLTCD